jgi:hypothetical protein
MKISRSTWAAVVVAALIAVGLVLVGTGRGPGVSPDSTSYISGAENLSSGIGYVNYSLLPITRFPPGFSMTLAVGDRLGIDADDGARWLNAFAFGALVVLVFLLARRHVRNVWLAAWAATAVAFAPAMLGAHTYALTESVFSVLVVAMLLVLEPLMQRRGRDPLLIILAAVVGASAFLYRYAGITVVALPVLVIVVSAWRDQLRAVLVRVLAYVALASAVPALVIARNLSEGSDALGDRPPSTETVRGVTLDMTRTFSEWTLDARVPAALRYAALAAAAGLVFAGLGSLVRRRTRGQRIEGAPLLPLAAFVVSYLAYMVVGELTTSIDPLNTRLLAPAFAPSVVLAAIAVQELVTLDWRGSRRLVTRGLGVALVLWLGGSLAASAVRARHLGQAGQVYSSKSWQDSDLAARVRELPRAVVVFSNHPDGIYSVAGRQPVYLSPVKGFVPSPDEARRRRLRDAPGAYLAWYRNSFRGQALTPGELRRRGLSLEPVTKTSDGVLYRVG